MLNIEKGAWCGALGRWVRRGQVWPVWERNGRPVGGVRPKQARDFAGESATVERISVGR
jgi:hypothetical protein